jgi:iron(III) transport system permease protein
MISCLIFERPGRWRIIGLTAALGLCAAPMLPLLIQAGSEIGTLGNIFTDAFVRSLFNSFFIAILVGTVSYTVGIPLGVVSAVFHVRGHKVLMALLALPLLLPSFLVAIGWSSLVAGTGEPIHSFINGRGGCVLVFSATGIPLAMLTAYAACTNLTGSQLDAVRLSGGAGPVLRYVFRYASTPTLLAAVLAAILSVSDPGPGQIFGVLTAGSEILTSLAALYDFALAGQQCLALGLLVLLFAAPLILLTAPSFTSAILARQTRPAQRILHSRVELFGLLGLVVTLLVLVTAPLLGLFLPLGNGVEIGRAMEELRRTTGNTVLYAVLAGGLCTCLALCIAFFIGRNRRAMSLVIAILAIIFVLPPSLGALGILQARSLLSGQLDPLVDSRLIVAGVLALRFVPVAAVFVLRSWGATSPSWTMAAAIHGVPFMRYVLRILAPSMIRSVVMGGVLVGLLATSDVVTVLLIHPPGEATLPLAIFTIMANAPESLVASLCLLYVAGASVLLIGMTAMIRRTA